MKQLLTILSLGIFILLSGVSPLHAQSYKWVKGGGTSQDLSADLFDEEVDHMCTDANGNVYTVGVVGNNAIIADTFHRSGAYGSYNNVFITSYNCSGQMRWAKLIGSTSQSHPYGIAADSHGHVYVSGLFLHGITSTDALHVGYDTTIAAYFYLATGLVQYDTSGEFNWLRFLGNNTATSLGAAGGYYAPLTMDASDNVHFICNTRPGAVFSSSVTSHYGIYDIAFNASGTMLGATQLQFDSTLSAEGAVIDNDGKLYVHGVRNSDFSGMTAHSYIASFDIARNLIWTDTLSNPGGYESAYFSDVVADGLGHLYLTAGGNGTFAYRGDTARNVLTSAGYPIASIIKISTLGSLNWMKTFSGTTNSNGFVSLTLMPNNKVAAAGVMLGQVACGSHSIISYASETENAYFTILDSSGHVHDLQQIHGQGNYDIAYAITSDNVGNLYIGGATGYNEWGGSLAPYTTVGGNTDYFIMKYGMDCSCTIMPVANYTVTGGITKTFTYTGTTAGIDSVRWDFGDGGTSTAMSPTHTYTTGDTFTACITVYTACGSDMHCSDFIIPCVTAPTAAYTTSGTGLSKTFTYTGTGLGIGTLSWDFGDGTSPSTITPVAHTFSAAGTYNVCLTATNSCGTNTSCTNIVVTCTSAPVSNFTAGGTGLTRSFTYTGTSSGIDSVTWTFGDGGIFTGLTPSHTFAIPGTYNVCATVHSNCGTNVHCSNIVVTCSSLPAAAFTSSGAGLSPGFTYTGTTTGLDSVTWTFGDGGTAAGLTASHTYLTSGTYMVCATVHTNCGNNTSCSNVIVTCTTLPVAAFVATGTELSRNFSYTGTTTGMDSVTWTFGDGSTATGTAPSHTYLAAGSYMVCATVHTNCGNNTSCNSITVSCSSLPVASFNISGTAPAYTFIYSGTTAGMDSVRWYFGDGGTSNTLSPPHTFTADGTYHVCVTIYTNCGSNTVCHDIVISCVLPVVASFSDTGHIIHGFAYTGTTSAYDSVVWTYGDGHGDTGIHTIHTYAVADTYHVCATVYTDCGTNTTCTDVIITNGLGINDMNIADISVYPNPATNELYVNGIGQVTDYRLLSVTGVSIKQGRLQPGNNTVPIPNVASGVYMLEMTAENGQRNTVRIIKG